MSRAGVSSSGCFCVWIPVICLTVAVITLTAGCGQESTTTEQPSQPPIAASSSTPSPVISSPTPSPTPSPTLASVAAIWATGKDNTEVDGPLVLTSTDGGETWSAFRVAAGSGLYGEGFIAFADADSGWLVDGADALVTHDAGATWATTDFPGDGARAIAVADAEHLWVAAGFGDIVSTRDGGSHWQRHAVPLDNLGAVDALAFADSHLGYALCNTTVSSSIAVTTDGGAHWRTRYSNKKSGMLYSVTFTDRDHAWAVGEDGRIIATSDSGAHWQLQHKLGALTLRGVSFIDNNQGWAVGWDEASGADLMLTTTDGGSTWTDQDPGARLLSVVFIDASTGWAMRNYSNGYTGVVTTTDGGASWTEQPLSGVFDASEILASRDDGQTYTRMANESDTAESEISADDVLISSFALARGSQ